MGSTSPERPQPVWCPGPFILGRDWTRASRRVGLQQFCRAQISLAAQSEPLAGRDICCLTFLIYTSPPSHTNTQFCSPPLQTSPSPSITKQARKKEETWVCARGAWHASRSLENFAQQLVWNVYLHHPFNVFRVRQRRKPAIHHILLLPSVLPHNATTISYVF